MPRRTSQNPTGAGRRGGTARGLPSVLVSLVVAACTSAPSPSHGGSGGTGGTGGTGASGASGGTSGTGDVTGVMLSLRVVSPEDGQPIEGTKLEPGESVTLVATAIPAVSRTLRLALLGDAVDASLGATDVETSSLAGTAEIALTAPSAPALFGVRVTTPGAAPFILPLAVPGTGTAHLNVGASYAGERIVSQWTASAWEDTTCASLTGAPPEDSNIVATSTTFPVSLDVRAGVPLAVILRAGRYVWGCATVDPVTENATADVKMPLIDVPIKLDGSQVRFTLGLDPPARLTTALGPAEDTILAALAGSTDDDVDALLDAMQATLADPTAFRSTRRAEKWDSYLRDALPGGSAALRNVLGDWIASGFDGADFGAMLVGDLKSTGSPTTPVFALKSALGLTPELSTFGVSGDATWQAGADDTVLIGARVTFDPTGLLLGIATGPALEEFSDAQDLATALALGVSCKKVAQTLVAHGESPKHSTDGCDAACTEALCRSAVTALLARASTPAGTPATFDLGIEGSGFVGDQANLVRVTGTWLGKLVLPTTAPSAVDPAAPAPISLDGEASAVDPDAPPG